MPIPELDVDSAISMHLKRWILVGTLTQSSSILLDAELI